MTVEVQTEATQVCENVQQQEESVKIAIETKKVSEKEAEPVKEVEPVDESKSKVVEKSSSFKEESNFLSDLKDHEKKALSELKSKLEEAINGDTLFKKDEPKPKETLKTEECAKEEETPKTEECANEKEKSKSEEKDCEEKEESKPDSGIEINKDISIWGVPLFPCNETEGTNVVLLKFLRARDFKVNESFEMIKKTLLWRKESNIDSILDEDLGCDLASAAYMSGVDREGHPICYNIFGVLDDEELYKKTFGAEATRGQFLRWRVQLMEKGIQKLDLKAGGVNSLLQINDLKNSPGPAKKEVRVAIKEAVGILQDNYPEFVARNIFINVPYWYYAFHALMSPFLTQRTKSKFVVVHPAKVTETLLKYIPIEEIPIQYGGLKRENDFEFSIDDGVVSEILIKAKSTETIEIPAPEAGTTFIWDVTCLGWEVYYKEEFVPMDECSYTIIVQKGKKISSSEGPIRNTFKTNESGKIVLTFENSSSKKKKVFYRFKVKKSCF
ncbi:hypothetical protein LguiB_033774 [Lonicera macranthoides]